MERRGVVKVIGSLVFLIALSNLVGWFFGIEFLKGWISGTITMKVMTSLSFIAVSVLIISLAASIDRDVAIILAFFAASVLLFFMGPFLFSMFTGRQTGFESVFIEDVQFIPRGKMPGWPSIGTVVAFLAFAVRGFARAFGAQKQKEFNLGVGWLAVLIGSSALLGYLLGLPVLYYNWGDFNAMAVNTAVLFILSGVCLVLLKDEK